MKSFKIFFLLFVLLSSTSYAQTRKKEKEKALRHVVMFKFLDSSSSDDVKKVEAAFAALPGKINLIKDFEWGTNYNPENLNQGLTHCFLVTFSREKDLDDYLVHPEHKAFVEILKPHMEKITVIDYWTR